jgi:Domain of unknown function (DUF4190)
VTNPMGSGPGGPPVYIPPSPTPTQGEPPRVPTTSSSLAIWAFVLSLVGFLIAWIPVVGFMGTVAAVMGVKAIRRASDPREPRKTGLAIAGLVIGIIDTVAALTWLIVYGVLATMSCPHVYAYDGETWRLDADPISGSLFAGGESDDMDRLEHLRAVDGAYHIRVADDLDEVDHIDKVALVTVDHPEDEEVLPAQGGALLRIRDASLPTKATDERGRDVLFALREADDVPFASRVEDFPEGAEGEPRERLILELPRPAGGDGVLVLRARNSAFAVQAFTDYLAQMGPGLGALLRSAQDSSSYPYKERLDDEMRRLGLHLDVEVWDGSKWIAAQPVRPIGPAVYREQAMTIPLPRDEGSVLQVRLTMAPLLWDVDRVRACARSELLDRPVFLTARGGSSEVRADAIAALSESDGRRVVLRKGEDVELTFDAAAPPQSGWTRTVFVSIRGYYEVDIGGRGLLDPFAVMAHRTGRTSLPRHALDLARKR